MKNTNFQKFITGREFFISAIIALVFGVICLVSRPTKKPDTTLTVGMMSGWAPFMTINPKGEFEGFDVDVAQNIAQRMGKKLEIQDLGSLASCFIALEQNKIDVMLSGLDITEQRLAKLSMIQYTGQDVKSFTLVFWKNIPENIKDLRTIPESLVCAEPGSAQEKFLDQFDFIRQKPMSSVIDMILDLKYGKSLAAILEPRVATRLKKQNQEIRILDIPLPKDFQVYGCGIALKKNNTNLSPTISKIIQDMKNDGTLTALEKKWQLEE